MKNINLQLTIDETNLVLEALGNLPFSRVFTLVAKIQAQASEQLNSDGQLGENTGSKQSG